MIKLYCATLADYYLLAYLLIINSTVRDPNSYDVEANSEMNISARGDLVTYN